MVHRSVLRRCCTLIALLLGMAIPLNAVAQSSYPVLITCFETTKAPANPSQYEHGEEITVLFSVAQQAAVRFILTNPDGDQVYGDWFTAEADQPYRLDGVAIGAGLHTLTAVVQTGIPGVPGMGYCEVQDLYYEVAGPPDAGGSTSQPVTGQAG